MADDWIKMRTDLYRHPKVCIIADILLDNHSELSRYVNQNMQGNMAVTRNVIRNATVGALVSVWGVLRHRGNRVENDLFIPNASLGIVDDIADLPGLGIAMHTVGWVNEHEDGIVLPRFFTEFNVDPADEAKAKNAARQRRYREKNKGKSDVTGDVSVASQSNYREEKEKEKSKDIKPLARSDKKPSLHAVEFDPETSSFSNVNGRLLAWKDAYPAIEVEAELKKAAAWLTANPKNRKSNYARFLNAWLSRAQDRAPARGKDSPDEIPAEYRDK